MWKGHYQSHSNFNIQYSRCCFSLSSASCFYYSPSFPIGQHLLVYFPLQIKKIEAPPTSHIVSSWWRCPGSPTTCVCVAGVECAVLLSSPRRRSVHCYVLSWYIQKENNRMCLVIYCAVYTSMIKQENLNGYRIKHCKTLNTFRNWNVNLKIYFK